MISQGSNLRSSTLRKSNGFEARTARLRIGVDLHTLEGLHQGSRTHCVELFSRVPASLPQSRFFFFADVARCDPRTITKLTAPNVEFVAMPHKSPVERLLRQLPSLAARYRLDLLHSQYITPPRLPCASALTVHDILFETFPEFFTRLFCLRSRLLVRRSARRASIVYSVSEYSKAELVRRYGIPREKITVIWNAADLRRFHPGSEGLELVEGLGLIPGQYLLTVGRLEPRKNHLRLLEAYASLPSPRPKLAVVGQRDFGFAEIFALTKKLGLEKDVLFLENVSDAALPALYRYARVFAYPTLAEGFGMPVVEAMASGVPVITSNTTALPEIAGDAALLIDPYSVPAIAGCLTRLLGNQLQAERLVAAGLEQARRFSWESEAAKLTAGYLGYFARQPLASRLAAQMGNQMGNQRTAEGVAPELLIEGSAGAGQAHQPLLG